MKKNDAMGWIVYILMLAVAAAVGFGMLRPALSEYALPMNNILFVVICVVAGILLSAILLEVGHILGAKIGKYNILKVNILGIQFKKKKDNKFHFSFSFSFDGLTGETLMAPKDVEKSNPRHSIYLPLLFLLIEVIACAVSMAIGIGFRSNDASWQAAYVAGLVVLVIVILVNLYNIFPAALDSKNDGYLMTILNNKTNVQAYNNLLAAQEKMLFGEPVPETPIYQEVTDFTNSLNQMAIYKALGDKDYEKALEINQYTIASKDHVSSKVYSTAIAQKLSLEFLTKGLEEVKDEYIDLPLDNKKFIAELSAAPSIRAYLLVSGLIDESETEAKAALERSDKAIKSSGEEKKNIEIELIKLSLKKVIEAHPDWDFSDYNLLEEKKANEQAEENKEAEPKEEKKDNEPEEK